MFLSYTPWKHQKIYVFRRCKVGTLRSNGFIIITFIYTKQIIHLSGPVDETSFYARDRLILVLGQKGDLTTRYSQIIWYARLPLKYTNMYLFTDKISAMNLMEWTNTPLG